MEVKRSNDESGWRHRNIAKFKSASLVGTNLGKATDAARACIADAAEVARRFSDAGYKVIHKTEAVDNAELYTAYHGTIYVKAVVEVEYDCTNPEAFPTLMTFARLLGFKR